VPATTFASREAGAADVQPKAFWHAPFHSEEECTIWYPMMLGWGGNFVTLLPGGISTIRIAKNRGGEEAASAMSSLVAVADRITTFCP
jgi:hypothetical protein